MGSGRTVRLAALLTIVATLCISTTAGASVVGTVSGDSAVLIGDFANDTITIRAEIGFLLHNLGTGTGFESSRDFDSGSPGEQTLTAAATLTIDAGEGDDAVVAGPSADHILGGGGEDRLTGATGSDSLEGGFGNDAIIWNNGDGTDTVNGDLGTDEQIMNGRTTDEDMTVKNIAGGRVRFDRLAPGGFGIDMGTIERLTINSFAGEDGLVTSAGVTLPMAVDAGPGDDTIAGGDGADVIQGGGANDVLVGDGGADALLGGDGADRIDARDGQTDSADCGAGVDSATLDGVDSALGCETVSRGDDDHDGHLSPADCDDSDPSRHPGAADVPGNGIDENCDGGDAAVVVDLDRDRDGFNRPEDCIDDNAAIHPRAVDVPQNGLNEDCEGVDADFPSLGSTLRATFRGFAGGFIKFKTLRLVRARAGSTIRISCSGRGCPFRKARRYKVRANRTNLNLLRRVRRIRLFSRSKVEVRVTRPGTIGLMFRWRGRAPRVTERCLRPGVRRPQRC